MRRKILFLLFTVLFFNASAFAANVGGKIKFSGTAPSNPKIDMGADPFCAGRHAGPVFTDQTVVSGEGGLKNVFIYVKKGVEGKTFPAPQGPVTLDQNGCLYEPRVFGVRVGQAVQILNSDSTLHNVHGQPQTAKPFNLGMPIKGMKLDRKFDKPEVMVPFKCDVHPWMRAYAGVLTHPYFAVSGADGAFEIKDLPPGKYTLEAWHEKLGVQAQEITVDETGTPAVEFTFAA